MILNTNVALHFHRIDEAFRWFKAGQIVFINCNSGILLDVPGCLCRSVLDNKAAKTSQINIFSFIEKAILYGTHEHSTTAATSFFCKPVDIEISLMISAFVILFISYLLLFFTLHLNFDLQI